PEDRLTLSLPLCRLVERMRHRTTPGARRAPRPGVSGEPRGLGPIYVRAMPDIRCEWSLVFHRNRGNRDERRVSWVAPYCHLRNTKGAPLGTPCTSAIVLIIPSLRAAASRF